MSSYSNSGISVSIGGTSIETISGYSVNTHRNSKSSSPVSYKEISVSTGVITLAMAQTLIGKAASSTAAVVCPDFEGTMYITSASYDLINANIFGKYCRVNISLTDDPDSGDNAQTLTITLGNSSVVCVAYTGAWDGENAFTVSAESGELTQSAATALMAAHATTPVSVTCVDYTGSMYITGLSNTFQRNGKYVVSLSLSTKAPDGHITINGISVGLTSYSASWNYEKETFEMYDYSQYNIYKGRRCSISYTTVPLTGTAADTLVTAFRNSPVTIGSGDYSGYMAVDSCSKSAVDQGGTTMYTFSVQCTAIALESGTVST